MGFASQEGHLGFRTQAAEGTYDDPGAAAPNNGVFMRHLSGGLAPNRELIIPDPEIGGDRDTPGAILGTAAYTGDIEFYGRMDVLATLVAAAFGTSVTTADTSLDPATVTTTAAVTTQADVGAHLHTITPTDSALALPWLSVEEDVAGNYATFQYTDARVNTFGIEAEPNGILMASAGLIAKTQLDISAGGGTPLASRVTDTTPLMVGTSVNVTIAGITNHCYRDFSLEFSNNMEDDVYSLGSTGLCDLTPKRRELTADFTLRPNDTSGRDLWRGAVNGTTTALTPVSGGAYTTSAVIDIPTAQVIPGSTVGDANYRIVIQIPEVIIEPFALEPNQDDVLEYSVTMRATRSDNANPLATVTIVNDFDSIV